MVIPPPTCPPSSTVSSSSMALTPNCLLTPFRKQRILALFTVLLYGCTLIWSRSEFVQESLSSTHRWLGRLVPLKPVPPFNQGILEVRVDADFEQHDTPFLPRRKIALLLSALEPLEPSAVIVLASFPHTCYESCDHDPLTEYLATRQDTSAPLFFQTVVRDGRTDSDRTADAPPIFVRTIPTPNDIGEAPATHSNPLIQDERGLYPFVIRRWPNDDAIEVLLALPLQIALELEPNHPRQDSVIAAKYDVARVCMSSPTTCPSYAAKAFERAFGLSGWASRRALITPPNMNLAFVPSFIAASSVLSGDLSKEWLYNRLVVVTNPSLHDSTYPGAKRLANAAAALATAPSLDCLPGVARPFEHAGRIASSVYRELLDSRIS